MITTIEGPIWIACQDCKWDMDWQSTQEPVAIRFCPHMVMGGNARINVEVGGEG